MNQDQIQDAIEDIRTWIGRCPASIDEMHYEREALNALDNLGEQIATLTAERDEARREVEQLRMAVGCATTIKGDMVMRADDPIGMMQEVCSYVAAIKSCPEMGEVDAVYDGIIEYVADECGEVALRELANIARRAIAANATEKQRADEAERLLKVLKNLPGVETAIELAIAYRYHEYNSEMSKILAICGKGVGT